MRLDLMKKPTLIGSVVTPASKQDPAIESRLMSKVLLIEDDGELAEEIVAELATALRSNGRRTGPKAWRWNVY